MSDDIKNIIQITKAVFELMGRVLELFNREMDQQIPWKVYKENVKEMRYTNPYRFSHAADKFANNVLVNMMHMEYNYSITSAGFVSWCSLISEVILFYLSLFTKMADLRTLTIELLGYCVTKLSDVASVLQKTAMNCFDIARNVTGLIHQFKIDINGETEFFKAKLDLKWGKDRQAAVAELRTEFAEIMKFYVGMQVSIDKANVNLQGIKYKLAVGIVRMAETKDKLEATIAETAITPSDLKEYRYNVEPMVYNFVAQCNEYQQRHRGHRSAV